MALLKLLCYLCPEPSKTGSRQEFQGDHLTNQLGPELPQQQLEQHFKDDHSQDNKTLQLEDRFGATDINFFTSRISKTCGVGSAQLRQDILANVVGRQFNDRQGAMARLPGAPFQRRSTETI